MVLFGKFFDPFGSVSANTTIATFIIFFPPFYMPFSDKFYIYLIDNNPLQVVNIISTPDYRIY